MGCILLSSRRRFFLQKKEAKLLNRSVKKWKKTRNRGCVSKLVSQPFFSQGFPHIWFDAFYVLHAPYFRWQTLNKLTSFTWVSRFTTKILPNGLRNTAARPSPLRWIHLQRPTRWQRLRGICRFHQAGSERMEAPARYAATVCATEEFKKWFSNNTHKTS